jgi:hypothetical protein
MGEGYTPGKTAGITMATIMMIKKADMVSINGLMVFKITLIFNNVLYIERKEIRGLLVKWQVRWKREICLS